jgi:catalase (peroxidase I)
MVIAMIVPLLALLAGRQDSTKVLEPPLGIQLMGIIYINQDDAVDLT